LFYEETSKVGGDNIAKNIGVNFKILIWLPTDTEVTIFLLSR
jgi:hypothetical protein